jgi:hypothetical protein
MNHIPRPPYHSLFVFRKFYYSSTALVTLRTALTRRWFQSLLLSAVPLCIICTVFLHRTRSLFLRNPGWTWRVGDTSIFFYLMGIICIQ